LDDKTLSEHSETLSTCRKGQGQRMWKKSGKKNEPFFFWRIFSEVSVFTALTVTAAIKTLSNYTNFPESLWCSQALLV
jgi:hypothetical protein